MPTVHTLYLVRHAIAAERSDKWPDDAKRPLTRQGAVRMRFGARGLASLEPGIGLVATSPLVRAVETAEILVRGLEPQPDLVKLALLAPGGAPPRIAEALAPYGKVAGIALVGHEPGIGELAAWLTGARNPMPFKKGAVCRIDMAEWPPAARHGTLVWLATPRMLRSLD